MTKKGKKNIKTKKRICLSKTKKDVDNQDDLETNISIKKRRKKQKKVIVEKPKEKEESETDTDEGDSEPTTESDEDEEEYDSEELLESLKKKMNFNVVFSLGKSQLYDADYEDDEEDDEEYEEADDEEEEDFIDECNEVLKETEELIDEPSTTKKTKSKKSKNVKTDTKEHETYEQLVELLRSKEEGNEELFKKFDIIVEKEKKKKEEIRKKKEKKRKQENSKKLGKLFREKKSINDTKYFKEQKLDSQLKILDELSEINKCSDITKPYRMALIESDMPTKYKAVAYRKINSLMYMDPGSGEYYKIKNWVDTFMSIPFGKYHSLPLTIKDGIETCNAFMENAKKILDESVYGLNDAKMQILQVIGQWIANPDSIGTAIAIKGPMGTGKTTLVKEGISKLLNRPFAFLALGGATDSAFLEGHSYTYEGSKWGQIVQILRQSKCMNPVIYFDELDKVSDTPKGEEIIGILTHLTDTIQNTQFHDKYFSELEFDLSKCLFIFSYNDETKINPILCDRMYRIETKGYDKKEKTIIAQKYMIPIIEQNVGFEPEQIVFNDDVIHTLIDHHTHNEKGVRNLKRCLEIIYTKINLYRLMKPDTKLYDEFEFIKIEYPFQVTKDIIDKLIKTEKTPQWLLGMYA